MSSQGHAAMVTRWSVSRAAPLSRSPAVWLDLASQQQLARFSSWGAAC